MMVVGGEPEFRMLVEVDILGPQQERMADNRLRSLAEAQVLIGVGEVGRGRHQERDLRGRAAGRRTHDERDVVDCIAGFDPRRINVGAHRVGNRELEIRLPPGVLEVVVVEMDRAVLGGRMNEVFLASAPVMAGHRARRRVDAASVQVVARGVGDAIGGNAGRADTISEVPSRDHPAAVRLTPGGEFGQFRGAERMTVDARAIDFAIVMTAGDNSS